MIHLIAATVTAIVTTLAATGEADVYRVPVVDGQAQPTEQVAVPDPQPHPADCAVLEIEWDGGPRLVTEQAYEPFAPGELRASVVGTYLWIQWDRPDTGDADSQAADIGSIELEPGTESVEVCR